MRAAPLIIIVLGLGCGGSASEPEEPAGRPAAEPAAEMPAPTPESSAEPAPPARAAEARAGDEQAPGDDTPAQYACRLADDFNQCIVERLEGRADTEAKMIQLIQSYRLLGRTDEARSHMERFIEEYADSPQANAYRDYLGSY